MATADADRRRTRRRTAVSIVALLVLSVPWYFPAGDGGPFIGGAPLWFLVSFACYTAIAAIVAVRLPAIWDDGGRGGR